MPTATATTPSFKSSKRSPDPRFATARTPSRDTLGPQIAAVARALGQPLLPWQQLVADVGFELVDGVGAAVGDEEECGGALGDRGVDERIERGLAEFLQHLSLLCLGGTEVAANERVGGGVHGRRTPKREDGKLVSPGTAA